MDKSILNTECIVCNYGRFYKTTFLNVHCVMHESNYYNFTRIALDNGFGDIQKITRNKYWKDYMKVICDEYMINPRSHEIKHRYLLGNHMEKPRPQICGSGETSGKSTNKISETCVSETSLISEKVNEIQTPNLGFGETSGIQAAELYQSESLHGETCEFVPITDGNVSFSIRNQTGEKAILNGVYMPKIFLHFFCEHVNLSYASRISYMVMLLDEELKLRKITFDQKIREYDEEIESLREGYRRSNAGFDHSHPGTIICKHLDSQQSDHRYRLNFKQNVIAEDSLSLNERDVVISSIYNVDEMRRLIYFYVRASELDFVHHTNRNEYVISDFLKFRTFIDQLQNYEFEYKYDVETIISNFIRGRRLPDGHLVSNNSFYGSMFEFFCSKKYELSLFKYQPTEKLGLNKKDVGVDLIDIGKKVIAQCEYYRTGTLTQKKMSSFIDMVNDYIPDEWRCILFVNESAQIDKKVEGMETIEIVYVPDNEINQFIEHYTGIELTTIIEEGVPIKIKHTYAITKNESLFNRISEFISNCIATRYPCFRDDVLAEINEAFASELTSPLTIAAFGQAFRQLYYHNSDDTLPYLDGKAILRAPSDKEDEVEFIRQRIGFSQYTRDEFTAIYNEHFRTSIKSSDFCKRFRGIFEGVGKSVATRSINGKNEIVLSLLEAPGRDEAFKTFIDTCLDKDYSEIAEDFNNHFHRYETTRSMMMILEQLYAFPFGEEIDVEVMPRPEPDLSSPEAWIKSFIGLRQMKCVDVVREYNEHFSPLTVNRFGRKYGELMRRRDGVLYNVLINKKRVQVFDLKEKDLSIFKTYLDSLPDNADKLSAFNKHFERFEDRLSLGVLYRKASL